MTIKQRGKEKICSSEFKVDKQTYRFSFNGKKGMPLITSKKEAREHESKLRQQIKAGTFIQGSPLKNFTKFYEEIFMDYSRNHKSELATKFDEYYGKILLGEFGGRDLGQITPRMVERFLLKLSHTETQFGRAFSPVTIRMIYGRLNQLFNHAIRERVVNENPCRLVSRAVLKEFPTWIRRERWLGKYKEDEEERLFKELDPQIATICRLLLNTGVRPPREILLVEKAHVNLSDTARHYRFTQNDGRHLERRDTIIPPRALLVAHGKGGRTRMLPLNEMAHRILQALCGDSTTDRWLFVSRDGRPLGSIKKGFAAACGRAGIEGLRPYDLRHTFATRLVERGVHTYVISALLGHSMPVGGFGHESRVTPGYAHATWEAMARAVESLERPPAFPTVFQPQSVKSQAKLDQKDTAEEKLKAG